MAIATMCLVQTFIAQISGKQLSANILISTKI
jgi:hypothetical protein